MSLNQDRQLPTTEEYQAYIKTIDLDSARLTSADLIREEIKKLDADIEKIIQTHKTPKLNYQYVVRLIRWRNTLGLSVGDPQKTWSF